MSRRALVATLQDMLDRVRVDDVIVGVLMVRLQRLREFRLVYGYGAGDELADAALATIRGVLRPGDEVHQVGEYEYIALLPRLHDRQHAALAGNRVVRAFQQPLRIDQRAVLASVAVGISVAPDHGKDAEALLRRAEQAYGEALRSNERSVLYTAADEPLLIPYEMLRDAITGNRLEVYLQPILDLRQRRVVGTESLARWRDPERGNIPPDSFIPLAEETGLISDLTRWSLNASLRHTAQVRRLDADVGVSINLSPRVFGERDVVSQLQSALLIWDVPATAVTLEVTETALMEDPALSLRLLQRLRDEGFGIAIDDFGAGYSSLAYLKRFPATELKIDRAFIQDLREDARSRQLVRSIIDLGHHLQMAVLAEGVEDAPSLEMLADMGCDRAQGYYIRRPQPAAEFVQQLRDKVFVAQGTA